MKKILVIGEASDKTQIALDKAMSLARLSDADVHVAINYFEDTTWQEFSTVEKKKTELFQEEQKWWQDYINNNNQGLNITFELLWEKYLVDWIINHCQTPAYDIIIKEGHRTESLAHTPTDWLLLRESPLPVYIVTPVKNKESKAVLVSLDLLAKSKEKQKLNTALLEEGFRLAMATNSDLHVCYVVKVAPVLRDIDLVDPDNQLAKAGPLAKEKLHQIADSYDIDANNIHILSGEPDRVISSLASQLRVNCIVIGSMGRKGILGKFFGNTSEQVVKLAHRDLLVIGPR